MEILVKGNEACGKTQFLNRLIGRPYKQEHQIASFMELKLLGQYLFREISGAERFKPVTNSFNHSAEIVVYCIDVSQPFDEEHYNNAIEEIRSYFEKDHPAQILLIATKTDIAVDNNLSRFENFRSEEPHLKTSAKNNEGIVEFHEYLRAHSKDTSRKDLEEIVNQLITNIEKPIGRWTSGHNSRKVRLLYDVLGDIKNPEHAFDLYSTINTIQSICAIKRNPLHFWKTPNSVVELVQMLQHAGLSTSEHHSEEPIISPPLQSV